MDKKEKIKPSKIEIMMRDYELMKNYSNNSPGIRYNIISFALATIGLVISGLVFALSSKSSGDMFYLVMEIVLVLMVVFLPAFCITIIFVWLGEEHRMMRAGEFCQELEDKINKEYNEKILYWGTFKKKNSIKYPEILIIALFLGISLGSSLVSLYMSKSYFGYYFPLGKWSLVFILLLHLLIFILVLIFSIIKILKLERYIPK